ncbi:hypothetical protein FQR65_LT02840 [Abscondita terminalis]|nr:hypothetical protein FQR65_LT02840 [Abscondita terminalis]
MPEESCRRPCNARLDFLARPKKERVLYLWENYIYLFPDERKESIKYMLQEMYSMTPEQTQKYFDEISAIVKKMKDKEKIKKRLYKKYMSKLRRVERRRALYKFKKIFMKVLTLASKNPVPPLISPRLKIMSDLILEQLCDIRGVCKPDRTNTDRQAQFFLNISDWVAIAIEYVYYEVNVIKNMEFEQIEAELKKQPEDECPIPKIGDIKYCSY